MIEFLMMQDASEVVRYDKVGFPLYIQSGRLSAYPGLRALSHWHEDIECMFIVSGEMNYDVNGKRVMLKTGDSLIVNSKEMHYGYDSGKKECEFICILFHPSLFKASELFYDQYVAPVIGSDEVQYIHFDHSNEDGEQMGLLLQEIFALKEKGEPTYEINVYAEIFNVWKLVYQRVSSEEISEIVISKDTNVELQKTFVSFIHEHFSENLSLDDIARSGNVSRSKCCHIFAKYLNQSPIDFLNAYRLEVASYLLKNTDSPITQIAISCGFSHPSYFAEIFKKTYGVSPRSFRKTDSIN